MRRQVVLLVETIDVAGVESAPPSAQEAAGERSTLASVLIERAESLLYIAKDVLNGKAGI